MKLLFLRSSPRKDGLTEYVNELFIRGVRQTDAHLTDIDLSKIDLHPCRGCFGCWRDSECSCVFPDGMSDLLNAVRDTDVLICSTPLYFFSMSSVLKAFFERTLPLTLTSEKIQAWMGTPDSSKPHGTVRSGKKFISIVVGAGQDPAIFEPLNRTFSYIANALYMDVGGQIIRPESYLLRHPLSKPRKIHRIESALVQAGREAGLSGSIAPATLQSASLPIARSTELFQLYSTIHAEYLRQSGQCAQKVTQVERAVGCDPRILMREMAECFNPAATSNIQLRYQFEFQDKNWIFSLTIHEGESSLMEGAADKPDLIIKTTSQAWANFITGKSNLATELREKRLVLEGNHSHFAKLRTYYPPPE